jgi:sporulation protein YlmC with PRC-barrel domain
MENLRMRKSIIVLAALSALPAAAFAQSQMTRFQTLQPHDMLTSNVVGVDVYDNANHDIGTIKDVAFDGSKAMKGYIVSVGGFLGMGTHYVAVDADSVKVKYDMSDKKWHANMNATKDELKAAPEFKYEGEWNASKS